MIFKKFIARKRDGARSSYEAIVAAARHPVPYAEWGVPDTIDGRFDMIALHMFLVLDRLKGVEAEFRQSLVDEFFADMDRSLREMGVGDLSVGKKVRKMAEAFYGRISAYEGALSGTGTGGSLVAAIARNVFPDGVPDEAASKLADYMLANRAALGDQPVAGLISGRIAFQEPAP